MAVIKVCSEVPFSKKSYHIEIGQLICKAINILVSIWYEFLLKGISEYTIVQAFFQDMLLFKKESNIDSLKIRYRLTLPFRLNSSKWKAICWVECYVNFFGHFDYLLLLTSFVGYWNFMSPIKVINRLCWAELFWSRRNWTVKKGNTMWIWIQLLSNENPMKISIKIINFQFTLKLPEIIGTSAFIIKRLKTRV